MGIVSCANEQYGSIPHDPVILRHFDPSFEGSVQSVTLKVLMRARREQCATSLAASRLADELSLVLHPLWPHRGHQILQSLKDDRWHIC
jgi:hypothetical protein